MRKENVTVQTTGNPDGVAIWNRLIALYEDQYGCDTGLYAVPKERKTEDIQRDIKAENAG